MEKINLQDNQTFWNLLQDTRHDSLEAARDLERQDNLKSLKNDFVFPNLGDPALRTEPLYFAGHSLGLMPKKAKEYVQEELEAWGRYGVEGHFEGKHPWLPYHENVTASLARLVGAKPNEVVAMNSLTVNLHLLLVSFYRPTNTRYKILIENNTFPSDKYAVDSQARFHGFDPKNAIVELKPREGELTVRNEDILQQIETLGDSLAVVMLGNCNYLSGQCFSFEDVVKQAHKVGAIAGFNLAHGAGNLYLQLHDSNVDFATWCSYKFLNAGPGAIAGAFIHETHLTNYSTNKNLPRFEGWWGHDKATRFKMPPQFVAMPTVESWQLSNPPIFQLASLRASLELFDKATMKELRKKGNRLTTYLDWLLRKNLTDKVTVITPQLPERGSTLSLRFSKSPKAWFSKLREQGAIVDFREPDIIRIAPAPLYNTFEDIYKLVQIFKGAINDG